MSALREAVARLGRHMAERRAQRGRPSAGARPLRPVPPAAVAPQRLFRDHRQADTRYEDRMIQLPGCRQPLWYTGPALDREDRRLFHWVLRREPGADGTVRFSAATCLRALGRGVTPTERQRLRRELLRLQSAVLDRIAPNGSRHGHSLIDRACWQPTPGGRSGGWRVWIDPVVRELFRAQATSASGDEALPLPAEYG